jgi:thioredoxin-like negative regulator of GroEL
VRSRRADIHLEEVDVTAHPEVAVKYRVLATPAIAIDGQLAFTGVPREEALRARLDAAAARGDRSP